MLNRWLFMSVRDTRAVTELWFDEYNAERPHGALDGATPSAYADGWEEENREAA